MNYFLRIIPAGEAGDANQKSSFHAIDTRADRIFGQRPFLNLVDNRSITMGASKNRSNRHASKYWLELSTPISKLYE
jgi:hypothetical protein